MKTPWRIADWNTGKIRITFGAICFVVFAVVGLMGLKRILDNRPPPEISFSVKEVEGMMIRRDALQSHPPIVWSTNGTVVTADWWDAANKCMARWRIDSDPASKNWYSWTRLPEYIVFDDIQEGESLEIETLKKENAALKKRIEELENTHWGNAGTTNYAITQDDLRRTVESVYPPPIRGSVVMTLESRIDLSNFWRIFDSPMGEGDHLKQDERYATIAPESFFTP